MAWLRHEMMRAAVTNVHPGDVAHVRPLIQINATGRSYGDCLSILSCCAFRLKSPERETCREGGIAAIRGGGRRVECDALCFWRLPSCWHRYASRLFGRIATVAMATVATATVVTATGVTTLMNIIIATAMAITILIMDTVMDITIRMRTGRGRSAVGRITANIEAGGQRLRVALHNLCL